MPSEEHMASSFLILPRCSFPECYSDCFWVILVLVEFYPVGLYSGSMARQKQAAPLQRATSSELMHLLPDEDGIKQRHQNGDIKAVANGDTKGTVHEPVETPGLLQLVICVLGIYASLYVMRLHLLDS